MQKRTSPPGRILAPSAALLCGATDSPREAAVRSQRPSKSRAAMARVRARGNALKKAVYAFKH